MGRALPEIDRLIEEGLTRYGRGDLDGALTSWEQALELDPHDDQALGYLDYVRMNYELLASEVSGHGEPPPFAISEDEPAHRIEAARGELAAGSATPRADAALDGWAIEEEEPGYGRLTVRQLTFEVGPDEPGPGLELEPFHARAREREPGSGVSFESATTEYAGARPEDPPAADDAAGQEFRLEATPAPGFEAEVTPGFGAEGDAQTPQGFGAQHTEVRPRDLGFVQPVAPAVELHRRATASTPELQLTLHTSTAPAGSRPAAAVTPVMPAPPAVIGGEPPTHADLSSDPAAELALELDPPTIERPASRDLLASLPARRAPPAGAEGKGGPTRDMPQATRAPASIDPPPGGRSTIEGLPPVRPIPAAERGDVHDFDTPTVRKGYVPGTRGAVPVTREPPTIPRPPVTPPGPRPAPPVLPAGAGALVSAPTRDLGLRQGHGADRDDDAPTGPVEVGPGARLPATPPGGGLDITRNDYVLPFDPIDARSAQILAAVDGHMSPAALTEEPREERTRRRIMGLFDQAGHYVKDGELDRAVTAIDLALSEDPNSALAQRLIQRNRETIMNVFQGFLGDLQRTPMLARPLHELAAAPISPRAAFLLSRVDGLLSIDEILDVSGMPRMEAYRYLCQLFLRGILR